MLSVIIVSGMSWAYLSELIQIYIWLVEQMYGHDTIDFIYACGVD